MSLLDYQLHFGANIALFHQNQPIVEDLNLRAITIKLTCTNNVLHLSVDFGKHCCIRVFYKRNTRTGGQHLSSVQQYNVSIKGYEEADNTWETETIVSKPANVSLPLYRKMSLSICVKVIAASTLRIAAICTELGICAVRIEDFPEAQCR